MMNEDEFLDMYIKGISELAHEEQANEDYFECMNDYVDGTMSV